MSKKQLEQIYDDIDETIVLMTDWQCRMLSAMHKNDSDKVTECERVLIALGIERDDLVKQARDYEI